MTYKQTRVESETVITINEADLADGFFTVHTSRKLVAERLSRAVGSHHIIKFWTHDIGGEPATWFYRIHADVARTVIRSIKSPSAKQIAARKKASERMRAARAI